MALTKDALRARFKQFRASLGAEEHGRRSDRISERLRSVPEILRANTVHVFWPIPERFEIDTRSFIAWLYTHKKQIVLPVVLNQDATAGPCMEHRVFEGEDALVRNHLGIHEPAGAVVVDERTIDVVVAPALGADFAGNRLGYGRGFYDRFLATIRVPIVCPVYHECVVRAIPTEAHDVPVDVLVTDQATFRVGSP